MQLKKATLVGGAYRDESQIARRGYLNACRVYVSLRLFADRIAGGYRNEWPDKDRATTATLAIPMAGV